MISKIIKVEVKVISLSRTRIYQVFYYYIKRKKWQSCSCFFTEGKQHNVRKLDMIMITCDLECPSHDYCIICSYSVTGAGFEKSLNAFSQSENS